MADINWSKIKKEIILYTRNVFSEQGIGVSDSEINLCVNIFYNILTYRTNYALLNGIDREMLPALQQSCCDNKGSLKDLRTIKTLVDAFLKRLLIISGHKTYHEVNEKCTKELFVLSGVVPSYSMNAPRITAAIAEGYKGDPDGLYLFAYTAYRRNEVHISPDDDASIILYTLKHVIGFYIFMIHRFKERLLQSHPEFAESVFEAIPGEDSESLFYDFMNYGSATNALKNRVVNSFVFFNLYQKDMQCNELIKEMVLFSKQSLTTPSAKRLLERLESNGRITSNKDGVISLSEVERERLTDVYSDYSERIQDFNRQLKDIINNYSLNCNELKLFSLLKSFFENNFNIDLIEINDDITLEGDNIHNLCAKLEEFDCPKKDIQQLMLELLTLCKNNDVLVRLGLGKLFTKITNPDVYESIVRVNKKVYLDTTIILYALCYNTEIGDSVNRRYRAVKNLLSVASGKQTINLLFSDHYLSEVLYHLRQALLLIPFADRFVVAKQPISTNVFYQYYFEMRKEGKLPNNIESFADFLMEAFNIEEQDAYSPDFWDIASGIVSDILYDDLNINLVNAKVYQEDKVGKSSSVFISTSPNNRNPKIGSVLKNDAIMGLILFDHPAEEPDPFFLTWDLAFANYRKKYIEQYKRSKKLFWHLFSPQKFVNHLDLLEFKVNVDSLSDDLLSLIESDDSKIQTKYVIDRFSRFLDIPGMDPVKRRKYIALLSTEILNEHDFPNTVEAELEIETEWSKAADLLDKILDYYKESGVENLKNYSSHVVDEGFFRSLLDIIVAHMNKEVNSHVIESIVKQLDSLMNA